MLPDDDEEDEEEEEELEEELGDLVREPGVCSYDKGYATTHVFVCRTCSLASDPHTVRFRPHAHPASSFL